MNEQAIWMIESFNGIQGEGYFAGTPTYFIRLPFCNIKSQGLCATWDGRKFPCDTCLDNPVQYPVKPLLEEAWEHHICITGGEPFVLNNLPSVELIIKHAAYYHQIHFETNGTMPIPSPFIRYYIACSPKTGFLPENARLINEFRLLVDKDFDPERVPSEIRLHDRVYLSPVWDENGYKHNLHTAMRVLEKFPKWKLSLQMHKLWGVK